MNLAQLHSLPDEDALGAARVVFFAVLDGHHSDQPVANALQELKTVGGVRDVRVLGSYERAAEPMGVGGYYAS